MKFLIVDDSNINLKVTQRILEKLGYSVDIALSGYECLEKVKVTSYSLIFMDIMMPDMDGVETLNKLKKFDNFNTPVIALTADVQVGAKEKYIKLGFNDYIGKPIKIDELKLIIEKY